MILGLNTNRAALESTARHRHRAKVLVERGLGDIQQFNPALVTAF